MVGAAPQNSCGAQRKPSIAADEVKWMDRKVAGLVIINLENPWRRHGCRATRHRPPDAACLDTQLSRLFYRIDFAGGAGTRGKVIRDHARNVSPEVIACQI